MKPRRFFFIMVGSTIALCLLILATVILGNNLLQKQATKLSELRAEGQVVDEQKVALVQGKKDIEKYAELDKIAKGVVPQDKDQARTVREINAIAAASGIELESITFPASNLGQAAKAPAKPAEGGSATPAPAQPGISQVTPVQGISGVYALPITISPSSAGVPYYQFLTFLEKLENNRRTAHVDQISITPVGSSVTFTLTLNAYVKP